MNKILLAILPLIVIIGCSNPVKEGEFFDEQRNLLGTCTEEFTPEEDGIGGTVKNQFYDLKGNLLGSCSEYSGPGASGWKGGCDEESLKNNIGVKVEEGEYKGRIAQSISCEFE
tara:strand:- start:332 stop:673 length:342 start_codon:yes stop_codon:yes gene_type:complete